jgi:hypothetical protein
MGSALILCDGQLPEGAAPDHVACVNLFDLQKIRMRVGNAVDLLEIPVEIDAPSILRTVDKALVSESLLRPTEMRWAPLALQRMFCRYIHYVQYKKRIACWLSTVTPDTLCLSSDWDKYLVLACKVCCEHANIRFEVLKGEFTPYSGADPFSFAETLPSSAGLDPKIIVRINGILTQQFGSVIYEPYWNLDASGFDAISFKWWRSVAARGYLTSKFATAFRPNARSRSFADYSVNLNSDEIPTLLASSWDAFDVNDLLVLRSGLASFQVKFNNAHLDKIHECLSIFFRCARPARLIVLDTLTPSCRILISAAKKNAIHCDFLPHGLIFEDSATSTKSNFQPSRILAWNQASAQRYLHLGCSSVAISHPRNGNNVQARILSDKPISERRILVLASTSSLSQIDAQDRDLLDILVSLREIGVRRVDLKLHAASKNISQLQHNAIARLKEALNFRFSLLDSFLDSQKVMVDYDFLIIGGHTSAILEAARYQIPFVIFRGELSRVGCLDGIEFPSANSSAELIDAMRNFDYIRHREYCQVLSSSLVGNAHPLDNSLN